MGKQLQRSCKAEAPQLLYTLTMHGITIMFTITWATTISRSYSTRVRVGIYIMRHVIAA